MTSAEKIDSNLRLLADEVRAIRREITKISDSLNVLMDHQGETEPRRRISQIVDNLATIMVSVESVEDVGKEITSLLADQGASLDRS